jgi:hypothetical protein
MEISGGRGAAMHVWFSDNETDYVCREETPEKE